MSFELVAPRVDFLDPRTGKISREWFSFFRILFDRVGGNSGTNLEDLINQLNQVSELQSTIAELTKRVQALEINQ